MVPVIDHERAGGGPLEQVAVFLGGSNPLLVRVDIVGEIVTARNAREDQWEIAGSADRKFKLRFPWVR
jgi:hypothetical protein